MLQQSGMIAKPFSSGWHLGKCSRPKFDSRLACRSGLPCFLIVPLCATLDVMPPAVLNGAALKCAGKIVDGYPFQASGKIVSPVTITRLVDGPSQQLLVSCFDGFFYVIDAATVCAGPISSSDMIDVLQDVHAC